MSSRLKPNVICVRSFVPKLKKSASAPISSAVSAGPRNLDHRADRDIELALVLLLFLTRRRSSARTCSAQRRAARAAVPTSGIMISAWASIFFSLQAITASVMAVTCISRISGYVTARRQPRWPSIGFISCSWLTRVFTSAGGDAEFLGRFGLRLRLVRQELVQRRIEQANRDRQAVHRLEDADEILALMRQQVLQGDAAFLFVLRQDHRPHVLDAVAFEEHVLGAAQADALGAELAGPLGILRRVGVRANLQRAILVGPVHHRGEVAGELRRLRGDRAGHHFAGRAVDRERVVVRERLAADFDLAGLLVDRDLAGAGDAAAAPAAGDHGRVARHAAGAGENADGRVHALDVFGVRFLAHEQHLLAGERAVDRFGGRERQLADRGARRSGQAERQQAAFLLRRLLARRA